MEVKLHTFLTSSLDGGEWAIDQQKHLQDVPQSRFGHVDEDNSPTPTPTFHPLLNHITGWAKWFWLALGFYYNILVFLIFKKKKQTTGANKNFNILSTSSFLFNFCLNFNVTIISPNKILQPSHVRFHSLKSRKRMDYILITKIITLKQTITFQSNRLISVYGTPHFTQPRSRSTWFVKYSKFATSEEQKSYIYYLSCDSPVLRLTKFPYPHCRTHTRDWQKSPLESAVTLQTDTDRLNC